MFELAIFLYLFDVLNNFQGVLIALCIVIGAGYAICNMIYLITEGEAQSVKPYILFNPKALIVTFFTLLMVIVSIPSERIGYILVGLYYTDVLYQKNSADLDEITMLSLENVKMMLKDNLKIKSKD